MSSLDSFERGVVDVAGALLKFCAGRAVEDRRAAPHQEAISLGKWVPGLKEVCDVSGYGSLAISARLIIFVPTTCRNFEVSSRQHRHNELARINCKILAGNWIIAIGC